MPKFLINRYHTRRDCYEVDAATMDEAYAMVEHMDNPDLSDNPRIAVTGTNEFVDYDDARGYELDADGTIREDTEQEY